MFNKSYYEQPRGVDIWGSVGGAGFVPEYKRDWRNGEYQQQDKVFTFRKRARDPGTGKFTAVDQKTICLNYVRPADPKTAPQIARRAIFTAGVIASQALSDAQKEAYRILASRKVAQTWWSLAMRDYLRSH